MPHYSDSQGMAYRTEMTAKLRTHLKAALVDLENKDVADQAEIGLKAVISKATEPWETEIVLRDVLAVEKCSMGAIKHRFR